jgi:hypothetical protein
MKCDSICCECQRDGECINTGEFGCESRSLKITSWRADDIDPVGDIERVVEGFMKKQIACRKLPADKTNKEK